MPSGSDALLLPELEPEAGRVAIQLVDIGGCEAVAGAAEEARAAADPRRDPDLRLPDEEAVVGTAVSGPLTAAAVIPVVVMTVAAAVAVEESDVGGAEPGEAVQRHADRLIREQPVLGDEPAVRELLRVVVVELKVRAAAEHHFSGEHGTAVEPEQPRRPMVHVGDLEVGREQPAI